MIRPMLGKYFPFEGLQDMASNKVDFKMYPNPVTNNVLHIEVPNDTQNLTFQLYNSQQCLLMNQAFSSTVSLESLASGVYFVNIFDNKTKKGSIQKLVIIR